MMPEANHQFARLAAGVWGIDPVGKTEADLAEDFVDALAAFIREIGLPSAFAEMNIPEDTDYQQYFSGRIMPRLRRPIPLNIKDHST